MLIPTTIPPQYKRIVLRAEQDPMSAVALAHHLLQPWPAAEKHEHPWVLYTAGWTLMRASQHEEARRYLEAARQAFADLDRPIDVLYCRRALLITALMSGAGAHLQADWQRLTDDYQAAGLPLEAKRTCIHQIGHLNIIGTPLRARALARQIEAVIMAEGTIDDQARFLRVTAIAVKQSGDLETARSYLDQATKLFTQIDNSVEIAKCLLESVPIFERCEQLHMARARINAALVLFRKLKLPLYIAACEKNLGLIYSGLGQFNQALAMTLQARTTFLNAGHSEQAAGCDLNLGNIAYFSGLYDLALAAYHRAEAVYTRLELQREFWITQRNQALVLQAQGKFRAAYDMLRALEEPVANLGDALELAEIYQSEAQALRALQTYPQAIERITLAAEQFRHFGSTAGVAECLLDTGWIYLEQGEVKAAQAALQQAYQLPDNRPMNIWRIEHGMGRCAQAMGAIQAAFVHYQQAGHIVAGLRQTLATEHASSGLFTQARQLYDDAIMCAAEHGAAEIVLALAEQQRALALQQRMFSGQFHVPPELQPHYEQQRVQLRSLIETDPSPAQLDAALTEYIELLLQVRHCTPFGKQEDLEPLNISRLRTHLADAYDQDWLVLSYVWCHDELLIITLDQESVTLTRKSVDRRVQHLLAQAYLPRRRLLTYLDWPRQHRPGGPRWASLAELGEWLLPPEVQARLQPHLRLLIVPSGILHSLPWAALRIANAWLCERSIIQLIPALTLWESCVRRRSPSDQALLIGCSQFGSRAPSLQTIDDELKFVTDSWKGNVTYLYDAGATRSQLLRLAADSRLEQYGLIHIASHAQLVAEHGLLARILLWDEDLLYDEVSRLPLNGALVILSTCDGAASEVLPGEEVMSLNRAFLAAGARNVIASLWPSYDLTTPILMSQLYTRLSQGYDPATALAYAQRALITQQPIDGQELSFASPLVWGGWHIVGGS
ncbi:MAG TPA: CHAT domain-containing protein [Herpetosiphonaceae bacterium]